MFAMAAAMGRGAEAGSGLGAEKMAQDREDKRRARGVEPMKTTAMDRAAFEAALDAFGGDLQAWPPERGAAARALLEKDPGARASLATAERLEALFAEDRAAPAFAPPSLAARMMTDARGVLAETRASAVARSAAPAASGFGSWAGPLEIAAEWLQSATEAIRERLGALTEAATLGGGVGLAAAAGLAVSLLSPLQSLDIGAETTTVASAPQVDAMTLFGDGRGEEIAFLDVDEWGE